MFADVKIYSKIAGRNNKRKTGKGIIIMKKQYRTLILTLVILTASVLLYSFSPATSEALAEKSAVGTIKVCWGLTCATDVQTTIVNLVNSSGVTVGTCTITPPDDCCDITGDFPSGTYQFVYYRPTGVSDCRSARFNYINGTDVTLQVICACP
jgi:hypothetical protein